MGRLGWPSPALGAHRLGNQFSITKHPSLVRVREQEIFRLEASVHIAAVANEFLQMNFLLDRTLPKEYNFKK